MMREEFKKKCRLLSERLDVLNDLLTELKQRIILNDLSIELGLQVKAGRHLISGTDWLEETDVGGESFNLINQSKEKYYSYVVYTEKEYHTVRLGFMYKKELISPQMDFCVEKIVAKYNAIELDEITKLIDEAISNINVDIDYLVSNSDIHAHKHYFGEYNKGFDSYYRYDTISDVINDYKKR